MTADPDQVAADLAAAVDRRLAARLETARRRRAAREQARAEKNARRTAGLRARHAAKLARLNEDQDDKTASRPQKRSQNPTGHGESLGGRPRTIAQNEPPNRSTVFGGRPGKSTEDQDDTTDATALGRGTAHARACPYVREKENRTMPTTDPPPADDVPDAPEQRKGRYCGWEGKERYDFGATRLRRALTKLARDPDPAARAAGVRFSGEAAEFLHELATRADSATTRARQIRANADRMLRNADERLQRARDAERQ